MLTPHVSLPEVLVRDLKFLFCLTPVLSVLLLTGATQAQGKKDMDPQLFEDWKTYYQGCEKLSEFQGIDGAITALTYISNGKQLFIVSESGSAVIVEAATGKLVKKLAGHKESILDAAVSKDGKYAATASSDDTVKVWDIAAGTEWRSLKHPNDVKSVAFSPDGKKLVTGCADGMLRLWIVMDSKEVKALELPREKGEAKSPVRTVAWAGNGEYVMAGDEAGSYVRYDWKDYFPYTQGRFTGESMARVGFTPSCSHYYYLTSGGMGLMRNIDKKDHGAYITLRITPTCTAISANSRFMLVGSETGTVSLLPLDFAKGAERPDSIDELRAFEGHSDKIGGVAFSPDGAKFASGARDGMVFIWGSATAAPGGSSAGGANAPPLGKTLPERGYGVLGVSLSGDGRLVAACGEDFSARVYELASGALKVSLGGHTGAIRDIAFSPTELLVVTASDDKSLRVWNAGTGKEIRALAGHVDKVMSVSVSADGKRVVSASADKTIRVWELVSGKQTRSTVMAATCDCACQSADGKMIAACSRDGAVKIWEAASGKELKSLSLSTDFAQSLAFSPDSKKLATLSRSGKLMLWDVAAGTAEKTFEEGVALEGIAPASIAPSSLTFSKDGSKLARANATDVKIYKLADGSEGFAITGLSGPLPVTMTGDGKTLVTGGADGKLRTWDIGQ